MYFLILATSLFLQPVFLQECRPFSICNVTPGCGGYGQISSGYGWTRGLKGERGSQGESCALESFQPVITTLRAELEPVLRPVACHQSSINGVLLLRHGQKAYCDNGWTMFQRNYDSYNLDFNLDWIQYREGFGNPREDFWLGLEKIYQLTKSRGCRLRVDMWLPNGNRLFAEYSEFYIERESENYRLHIAGHSGTAGDGLDGHNNLDFTTKDRDNDRWGGGRNCANSSYTSGWWYHSCASSVINEAQFNLWGTVGSISKATMKARCD